MYNLTYVNSRKIEYIVIHYTATNATAEDNIRYFSSGDRNASADIFVNKDGSYEKFNPDFYKYYSWHCGDGNGVYGITNYNSLGIEVVSAGEDFTYEQKKTLKYLVNLYMNAFNIDKDRVVRHYDASRKLCPLPYCGNAEKDRKWYDLRDFITSKNEDIKEEDIMASKEEAAETTWEWPIAEDAVHGKNNAPAWKRLSWVNSDTAALKKELLRTDDGGTGDGTNGTLYRRICWMDARIRDMDSQVDRIENKLNRIYDAINKQK